MIVMTVQTVCTNIYIKHLLHEGSCFLAFSHTLHDKTFHCKNRVRSELALRWINIDRDRDKTVTANNSTRAEEERKTRFIQCMQMILQTRVNTTCKTLSKCPAVCYQIALIHHHRTAKPCSKCLLPK